MMTSNETEIFDKIDVINILTEIGYKLKNDRDGWRTSAIYRGGVKNNSLKINFDGSYKDFVTGESGSFINLIERTIGKENAKQYCKHGAVSEPHFFTKEKINVMNMLDKDKELLKLFPNHEYWINRGISEDIIKKFKGGTCDSGRFKGRYVFPIFDGKMNLVGLSGRLLYENNNAPKWKHFNGASSWKYPLFLNHRLISDKKSVIIVESIGDCLSLFEMGINNVVVSFGLTVSFDLINLFMRYELNKIIIAFNNDLNNQGNDAAEKQKQKIGKWFSGNTVKICLPPIKGEDFNSLLLKDKNFILDWHKNIKL